MKKNQDPVPLTNFSLFPEFVFEELQIGNELAICTKLQTQQ